MKQNRGEAADKPEGCAVIQWDLGRLERNLMRFNKAKCAGSGTWGGTTPSTSTGWGLQSSLTEKNLGVLVDDRELAVPPVARKASGTLGCIGKSVASRSREMP